MKILLELPDLQTTGARLKKVDRHLIALLSQRMHLARDVEAWKRSHNQAILRHEIEQKRLAQAKKWAKADGLDPNFAASMLYFAIRESCSVQLGQWQGEREDENFDLQQENEWYKKLKANLLQLTAEIAPQYDQYYDKRFFATHSYLKFEEKILEKQIQQLPQENKKLAVDLGCATGRVSFQLASYFDTVIGYDISSEMITEARKKLPLNEKLDVEFQIRDVEQGVLQNDNTANLVIMNLGTASDIRNIRGLLQEIERILTPEGKFILSFYNREALFYRWFIPWPVSLAAEINLSKHCLDVHYNGNVYSVYARPYSVEEVKELFPEGLVIESMLTYPTISSILPNEIFEEEVAQQSITEIDQELATGNSGAYILITGEK